MSVVSPRLAIILVSLLGSAGLLFWGIRQTPVEHRGNYIVLIVNEDVPDREAVDRLESQGFTGIISESRQWVFLDRFGGIEQIPLDEFSMRLLPIDPRNDGYAEKLRSLFVHDGKRFIFIPVGSLDFAYHRRFAQAMEDIPFSVEYASASAAANAAANASANAAASTVASASALAAVTTLPVRSTGFVLLVFCCASGIFLVFRRLRSALHCSAILLPCLPALVPLSLGGAAGFALMAVLCGLVVVLVGPRLDQLALFHQRDVSRWILSPVILACYGVILVFSGLSILFGLAVLLLFGSVCAFSWWSTSGKKGIRGTNNLTIGHNPLFNRRLTGHHRFSPVTIISRKTFSFNFTWAMIPYTIAALAVAAAGFAVPDTSSGDYQDNSAGFSFLPSGIMVSKEDYLRHFMFQVTFSQRSLHDIGSPHDLPLRINTYRFAPDGLPEPFLYDEFTWETLPAPPLFPLNSLLLELGSQAEHISIPPRDTRHDLRLALLPLFFIIPGLFVRAFSGRVIYNSHESIFVPPRGAFLRRPHRSRQEFQ